MTIMAFADGSARAETRELKLYNVHTQERATIVFKRDGKYDRTGLAEINHMLRDWRRNQQTKMDPQLLDLVWAVYRASGSQDYIHVICGYRAPETNEMLRKRSRGVAKHSQHTLGKAMDFYLPDVPLAKLRAIGLRAEVGGVGYYPTSGSPFVHMDTGSVRHWPGITRQQLVKIFPNGRTLHVPEDGKPLPGYAAALAAHKLRGKSPNLEIASADEENQAPLPPRRRKTVGDPIVIASVSNDTEDIGSEDAFDGNAIEPPLPRPSPVPITHAPTSPTIVAAAQPVPASFQPQDSPQFGFASIGDSGGAQTRAAPLEFESASHWSAPSVPEELARAMAQRDVSRPTSVPIQPTAVVATIDVTRPLRAETMTSAVMQTQRGTIRDVTPVFAYASAAMEASTPVVQRTSELTVNRDPSTPVPVANPLRSVAAPVVPVAAVAIERPASRLMPREQLTLTALDTLGLRLWMAQQSTRQKQYAVLTMPDFSQVPSLIRKPVAVYSVGFGDLADDGLRTDRFSGPAVKLPAIVDLQSRQRLAYR